MTDAAVELPRQAVEFTYSVVIPVFNSEELVGGVVEGLLDTFAGAGLQLEVICVNDGSVDRSWDVIAGLAEAHPNVVAVDLLRNYGQHNANLAGLREATGDYLITMDDDGQNPPGETLRLIAAIVERDDDVVFGRFDSKKASGLRRVGSAMIGQVNRRVFGQPDDLVVSNFRIMTAAVVDRISVAQTSFPYITGQALLASRRRSNVTVEHRALGGRIQLHDRTHPQPGDAHPVQLFAGSAPTGVHGRPVHVVCRLRAGHRGDPAQADLGHQRARLGVDDGRHGVHQRHDRADRLDDRRVHGAGAPAGVERPDLRDQPNARANVTTRPSPPHRPGAV